MGRRMPPRPAARPAGNMPWLGLSGFYSGANPNDPPAAAPAPSVTMGPRYGASDDPWSADMKVSPEEVMRHRALDMGPPRSAMADTPPPSQPQITDINQGGGGGSSRYNDSNYQAIIDELNAKGLEGLVQQRQGVGDLEKQLAAYANIPMGLDLSPLMQLSDQWFGGNQAQGYKAPAGAEQRLAQINALQQGIQKAKGGVTESEMDLLKTRLGNEFKNKELAQRLEELALRRQEVANSKDDAKERRLMEKQVVWGKEFDSEYGKKITGTGEFVGAMRDIAHIVKRNGGIPTGGDDRLAYDSATAKAIAMANKYSFELGALASDDVKFLTAYAGSRPDLVKGYLDSKMKGGPNAFLKLVTDIEKDSDTQVRNMKDQVNLRFRGNLDDLYDLRWNQYQESKKRPAPLTSGSFGSEKTKPTLTPEARALIIQRANAKAAAGAE